MADPYEVDGQGNPVAEADSVAASDPAATEALRRQVEATLRSMALSTVVGLAIIAILAVAVSSIRGVMILVGFVYLVTSVTAYWYLRRTFKARLARGVPATAAPVADPAADLPPDSTAAVPADAAADDAPPSAS